MGLPCEQDISEPKNSGTFRLEYIESRLISLRNKILTRSFEIEPWH